MQAVGLFGGTFDPIHLGHLRLAEELADVIGLSEVRFIPAGCPPHRAAPRAAPAHRLAMVERAVAGNPRFRVDAREVDASGPCYTVETLTALRRELGADTPLWLFLGADAFLGLPAWRDWMQLFGLAHLAVADRPGVSLMHSDALPDALRRELAARQVADGSAAGAAGSVLIRRTTPLAISATAIREALARGASVRYLVPDSVLDYLKTHALYA